MLSFNQVSKLVNHQVEILWKGVDGLKIIHAKILSCSERGNTYCISIPNGRLFGTNIRQILSVEHCIVPFHEIKKIKKSPPLHSSILRIQKFLQYNIPLCYRDSSDSWTYDGNSIALFQNERILNPAELLHEICHWVVAEPWQRCLPEWGLQVARINKEAWGSKGNGYRDENGKPLWKLRNNEHIVPIFEQTVQEFITQMLSIFLGEKFQVPLGSSYPGFNETTDWESYLDWKTTFEWLQLDNPDHKNVYYRQSRAAYDAALPRFYDLVWKLMSNGRN